MDSTYNGDTSVDSPSIIVKPTVSDPGSGAATGTNPPIGAKYTLTVDLPLTVVNPGPSSIGTTGFRPPITAKVLLKIQ